MLSQNTIVTDEVGFHARTAAVFSKAASNFESKVLIEFGEKKVNGKSMLALMTLGVKTSNQVNVITDGPDEASALASLIELIESNFVT